MYRLSYECRRTRRYYLCQKTYRRCTNMPKMLEGNEVIEMEAIKYDDGKAKIGLIPAHAAFAMGRALGYGALKYDSYNYKNGMGLDWDRYYNALLRHLFAWLGGEEFDTESGLRHTDHVLSCAAMLSDAVESKIGKDTRFKYNGED